jgi:hypothetical protein
MIGSLTQVRRGTLFRDFWRWRREYRFDKKDDFLLSNLSAYRLVGPEGRGPFFLSGNFLSNFTDQGMDCVSVMLLVLTPASSACGAGQFGRKQWPRRSR